jgi:hypothetical protein
LELITITGKNNCLNIREEVPNSKDIDIFPLIKIDSEEAKIFKNKRCYKFDK